MSCRAIDLELEPTSEDKSGAKVSVYTYKPAERIYRSMAESVHLDLAAGRNRFGVDLTPDEARVLANQLLQVADVADEQRAARIADDELQDSFDEISRELQEADGNGTGVFYAHPDVHYVPADQVEAKTRELIDSGAKRWMVLVEPSFEGASA